MEIHFTAKQIKVTPPIRQYVEEKLEKTQKYFNSIVWAQVFLSVEKRSHNAEFVLHAPGQTFRALATASDLYSAVDLAGDKINAQIKKFKEKLKNKHKTSTGEAVASLLAEGPRFDFIDQVMPLLTPEEAVRNLDSLERPFFLYQDKNSHQIHVAYRTDGEDYRIVRPIKKSGAAGK